MQKADTWNIEAAEVIDLDKAEAIDIEWDEPCPFYIEVRRFVPIHLN